MGYTPNTWRPMDVITSKKLNDLEQGLTQTSDNVVYGMGGATQSSDGIHSLTYINKGDALPNNPQVGDTIFMKDGDDFSILEWDGEQWNTRVDPKLSDRIQTALDEAKSDTTDQISKNNDGIKNTIDEVAQEKVDLAIKDADFNKQAQAMADKALADAKADADGKISSQQTTIDGLTDTVAEQSTSIDSITQRVTTAEGTLTTATNNITGLQTKQTTTANQVTQEIADRKTGDNNTLQSSKDFTTSSITSYDKGVQTQFTQTSDSIIAQVNTKTDQETVLALLKDNWSIGIKDNQDALTSGLFGDINGMTLNGKVVTIDANTTNITGTTWINSAMIANAAIQTVNIADAAITNAKIATLDVAKITGDVSNFIQSNWNGQFGSTTIDSTGMQVVTGKAKTKFGDGSMSLISAAGENIGWIGRQVDSTYSNLDFLTFGLNGWHTTLPGDDHYTLNEDNPDDFYGGDGIIFGISTIGGGYLPLLQWNSDLAAGYRGGRRGWMFTQPIVAGLTVYTENSNNDANGIIMQPGTLNGVYYPTLTSISSGGSTGYAIGQGASYMYAGNNRILRADSNGYLYYQTTKTGSSGKSLLMASDGAIIAQSSATKYKTDIRYEKDTSFGDRLLTIDPATWADKNEAEQIAEFNETGKKPDYAMNKDGARYYGLIAEDMVKAGLEELVIRDTITGAVEGIQYEKVGAALIPLLREQRNQINELKVEIERLKVKTSE